MILTIRTHELGLFIVVAAEDTEAREGVLQVPPRRVRVIVIDHIRVDLATVRPRDEEVRVVGVHAHRKQDVVVAAGAPARRHFLQREERAGHLSTCQHGEDAHSAVDHGVDVVGLEEGKDRCYVVAVIPQLVLRSHLLHRYLDKIALLEVTGERGRRRRRNIRSLEHFPRIYTHVHTHTHTQTESVPGARRPADQR